MIHSIAKPIQQYHCQNLDIWHTNWILNPANNYCYLFGRNAENGTSLWIHFQEAEDFCKTQNAKQLVIRVRNR